MANEISNATLVTNGGRISAYVGVQLHENLFDPGTGLRGLLTFMGNAGPGLTSRITGITRGYSAATASSEVSGGASNTLLTTTYKDITKARYILKMTPSDGFALTSPGSPVDVARVVGVLTESMDQTIADALCGLSSGVSSNVGTSGANLSVDNFLSAIYTLNLANNPGDTLACVLHPIQINDLMESARGEAGAMQFRMDAQDLLTAKGVGARFSFLGVQGYQSSKVASANAAADRQGMMFSAGAFAYDLGAVAPIIAQGMINPADILMESPFMFVERARDAANGLTAMFANFWLGVVEMEDARAVTITTDHE